VTQTTYWNQLPLLLYVMTVLGRRLWCICCRLCAEAGWLSAAVSRSIFGARLCNLSTRTVHDNSVSTGEASQYA
jgi:hypothetical protein